MIERKTTQDIFEEYTQQTLEAGIEWIQIRDLIEVIESLKGEATGMMFAKELYEELNNGK